MICTKCGAPVPAGMSKCPYCGAENSAAGPRRGAEEETSFAAVDEAEFPADDDGKTEFAGDAWASATEEEEKTEFAPQGAAVPPQGVFVPGAGSVPQGVKAAPAKKAPKAKKAQKTPKAGKKASESGHNNALRIVLLVVLAVLIVLLILR